MSKSKDKQAGRSAGGKAAAAPVGFLRKYRWPLIGVLGVLVAAGICVAWLVESDTQMPPEALLAEAWQSLEEHAQKKDHQPEHDDLLRSAYNIALELESKQFRDPNFLGALPFIKGIVDFRIGRGQADHLQLDSYRRALDSLEQAVRGLDQKHRLEGELAYGVCMGALGKTHIAEQWLLNIIEPYQKPNSAAVPGEFYEACAVLQEMALDSRSPQQLRKAIELNDSVVKRADIAPAERDQNHFRRTELHLALSEPRLALQALERLSPAATSLEEAQHRAVLQARIDIAEGRFNEARAILEPIAAYTGALVFFPRQASYLLGISYERENENQNSFLDQALRGYAETVRRYPASQEGLAANVRRAELLRRSKRVEEAFDAHMRALKLTDTALFKNRWLRLSEFRGLVLKTWDDLSNAGKYDAAIDLGRQMRPLFPDDPAAPLQRVAMANERAAGIVEKEMSKLPYRMRAPRHPELLERWRTSGKAYDDLADALRNSERYADVLRISADLFRKGHDFPSALMQVTRFINTQPKSQLPLAYLRKGEILMDMGRFDEALAHFQRVMFDYPKDIAAFTAMYQVGLCQIERNQPELAIEAWTKLLGESQLQPSAAEWQASLFALGRLQFQMAMAMRPEQGSAGGTVYAVRPLAAYKLLDESIRRLAEFISREPSRPQSSEARYLLARSLAERAQLPMQKLRQAETVNARKEFESEIRRLLRDAQRELDTLVTALDNQDKSGMLEPLGQQILRDSYFERAHNRYALKDYDRAIEAYTNAANRYPEDSNVFLAYIQMANCYERLGKPIDARGAAIQAMLIHKNMPDRAFAHEKTLMNRDDWKSWLEWARKLHHDPRPDLAAAPRAANS